MHRVAITIAAGALAVSSLAAGGAVAADLFVVHGINGDDLGLDEEFPLDLNLVSPDGTEECVLTDLEFEDVEGPATVDPGLFTFELYGADGTDCGGPLLVSEQVSVSALDTAIILAYLDASNSPVIGKFNVNATELDEDEGRISAIHAAVAPAVDIEIGEETEFLNVQNGQQTFPLTLPEDRYPIVVRDPATGDRLARRSVTVDPGEIGVGILVGSASNDTLDVLRLLVDATAVPMAATIERGEE
jgi:hypothetical protein